jgi:hypothetical protein
VLKTGSRIEPHTSWPSSAVTVSGVVHQGAAMLLVDDIMTHTYNLHTEPYNKTVVRYSEFLALVPAKQHYYLPEFRGLRYKRHIMKLISFQANS